jgi:glycosyltransferase involved in cell wall biosynthesis
MVRFSILIPVYNVSPYLQECLESISVQNCQNFEVIAIDDGSTDSSGQILDDYRSVFSNITIVHRNNIGVFGTRVELIERAQGEYIIFLDSDDALKRNAIEELNNVINKTEADVIVFGNEIVDEKGNMIKKHLGFLEERVYNDWERENLFVKFLNRYDLTVLWQKCIKRELLLKDVEILKKYTGINMGEDKMLSSHILANYHKLYYIDKPLYQFRQNGSSITATIKTEYIYDFLKVRHEINNVIFDFFSGGKIVDIFNKKTYRGVCWYLYQLLRLEKISKEEYCEYYLRLTQDELVKRIQPSAMIEDKLLTKIVFNPCFFIITRQLVKIRRKTKRVQ